MYKNDIPLLHRRDIPLFRGRNQPCSVCLIDLLRILACQRVHVVKAVGLKFVSYNILKIVLQKMHWRCDEIQNKNMT